MEAGKEILLMVSRKTIENNILTAAPGMNENSMDCGLPFFDKKDELVRQIDELSQTIYTAVVGFAESMALVAYGGRRKWQEQ